MGLSYAECGAHSAPARAYDRRKSSEKNPALFALTQQGRRSDELGLGAARAGMENRQVRIVLADDLVMVREGLASICESLAGYRVAGQCGDGEEALDAIISIRPDVALLDLSLRRLFTMEVVRRVREMAIATKIAVMSTRDDRKTVIEALRGGANAYLLKTGSARQIRDAFEQILAGGIYVSPLLDLDKVFAPQRTKGPDDPLETLSSREHQVFSMLVDGHRAKEIAARLDLSPKTVDTYRASLMRKLDIHDVAGLVKFAIQRNLTSPTPGAR